MEKLIFIFLDGLTYNESENSLGYMEHLAERGQCAKYRVRGELPSLSRPMYETIFTGLYPSEHGILNNHIQNLSSETSIFDICQKAGLKTLVCGYYWLSELYVSTPFKPDTDIILNESKEKITEGFFYYCDDFPDSHLYSIAQKKMKENHFDFVVIHPMGIDTAGHKFGSDDFQYEYAAKANDTYISNCMKDWLEQGYQIVVGSDHGMNKNKCHGGNTREQRNTAMYIVSNKVKKGIFEGELTTREFAPLFCKLLGMKKGSKMKELEVLVNEK